MAPDCYHRPAFDEGKHARDEPRINEVVDGSAQKEAEERGLFAQPRHQALDDDKA